LEIVLDTICNPGANNTFHCILVKENCLFAGGDFTTIQSKDHPYLAQFESVSEAPLPVFLLSFMAKAVNEPGGPIVVCQWKTGNEENSAYFQVERSSDGRHFIPIATIKASGNSASVIDYNYTDHAPLSGLCYYRLKMVDMDGSVAYSSIIAV
jgi:hypothetical protein